MTDNPTPALNPDDTAAVMEALQVLNLELADSGRDLPAWFRAVQLKMAQNTVQNIMLGADPGAVRLDEVMSHFLLGVMAGREGWPLVGDPIKPPSGLVLPS